MSINFVHAAGDMFARTQTRRAMYRLVVESGAHLFTFTEAQKDVAFIEEMCGQRGFHIAHVSELVIGWDTTKLRARGGAKHRKVMIGGRLGPLGQRRRHDRRGPDRYALGVLLEEKETRELWEPWLHHAIAKADTTYRWRRALRAQGFAQFADLIHDEHQAGAHRLAIGDWNTKGVVDLGIGLHELRTPATYGRLRYDRVQVDDDVRASRLQVARTPLDHKAIGLALTGDHPATHLEKITIGAHR